MHHNRLDSQPTTQASSSDGSRYYIGYRDGRIQTIDTDTAEQLALIIETHRTVFGSISGTAGGSYVIATTFQDGIRSMTKHDATTGTQIGEVADLNTAALGPDGTLVAANLRGEITEYDLDTLQPLGSFPGVRGLVTFSSSATTRAILKAQSFDRTVSIYDVATRTRIGDPLPIDVTIGGGSSLRPDGMAVAIGGGSGNGVAIWDLNPNHLAAACRLVGRNLTNTEWDSYLAALGDYRPTCPQYG